MTATYNKIVYLQPPLCRKSCISFTAEQEIGAVILPRDPCKKWDRTLINGGTLARAADLGLWLMAAGRWIDCAKEGALFADLARNIYAQSITVRWSWSRKLNLASKNISTTLEPEATAMRICYFLLASSQNA